VGGFFSLSPAIMSTVSASGESSFTTFTIQELKKHIDLFSARLMDAPTEPVDLTNAPAVRKWLQLARSDRVRKRLCR